MYGSNRHQIIGTDHRIWKRFSGSKEFLHCGISFLIIKIAEDEPFFRKSYTIFRECLPETGVTHARNRSFTLYFTGRPPLRESRR